jgi:SAM-dependent methyltransferase
MRVVSYAGRKSASTLDRLESLGWVLPDESEFGVGCRAPVDEAAISYPSAAYEHGGVAEATGFYLGHRADAVVDLLSRFGITGLWEIGAGNGNMAVPLAKSGFEMVAVELLTSGAEVFARQGVVSVRATLEGLSLPDASLPAVGRFDGLEHLQNPVELLGEVFWVLEPGGVRIVTAPAGSWLWRDLDETLGHFRRYGRGTLHGEVVPVGFRPLVVEHIYASLVPAAAILRGLPYRLGCRKSQSEVLAKVQQELSVPVALDHGALGYARRTKIVKGCLPPLWSECDGYIQEDPTVTVAKGRFQYAPAPKESTQNGY